MVNKEFGNPEELGKMIAKAKGKFRTCLKKQTWNVPVSIVIAVVIAFTLKAFALEACVLSSNSIEPVAPQHSRILFNKLTDNYQIGDVVLYKEGDKKVVGIVRSLDHDNDNIVVWMNKPDYLEKTVMRDMMLGKGVFLYGTKLKSERHISK